MPSDSAFGTRKAASIIVILYVVASLSLSGIPGWSRLSAVAFGLLLVTSFLYGIYGRLKVPQWIWWPIGFLTCCLLWSILVWDDAVHPFLTTVVAWGGGLLVAIHVQNGVRLDLVLKAFVASGIANLVAVGVGFDSYAVYVADFTVVSEQALSRRASGLVGNANVLAIQSILPLFALALWRERITGIVWLVALICAALALVVTGSRKGLYLALLFIPYVAYAVPSIKLRKSLVACCVAGAVALSALLLAGGVDSLPLPVRQVEAVKRIEDAMQGNDRSVSERLHLVEKGVAAFLESPVVGHGLDAFRHVTGEGVYAHNNILELAVNGGVVMLVAYYSVYIVAATRALRRYGARDRRRYLSLFLLLTLLGLEFGVVSYNEKFLVLLLLLILMAPSLARVEEVSHGRWRCDASGRELSRQGFASASRRIEG